MNIELTEIKSKDKSVLQNLFQLYLHDITKDLPMEVTEHGTFEYNEIDEYFTMPDRYAYFIHVDNKLAGFVMIDNKFMVLEQKENNYDLSEFFILNAYKGKGIGKTVAFRIFDMYKGTWEVKPVPRSKGVEIFWENVISAYTEGKYNTEFPKPTRKTFTFNNEK